MFILRSLLMGGGIVCELSISVMEHKHLRVTLCAALLLDDASSCTLHDSSHLLS